MPAVGTLSDDPAAAHLRQAYGAAAVTEALRQVLSDERRRLINSNSQVPSTPALLGQAERRLVDRSRDSLFGVINATGVVIHTNLGRAPLAPEALAAIANKGGYANLELDLETGQRSSRQDHLDRLITEITGAQAGIAVNNCAAAVMLTLSALAEGTPVIVSRGELVEIGGGYRVPDIVQQSGSKLVEIGTTNRTHLRDYEKALKAHPDARIILKTHPSNFRITGFTSAPSMAELAAFAHSNGLLLVEDLGGGALVDLAPFGITGEPRVQDSLEAGADLVLFSGDKLLGGPQAGIAAGRRDLIERLVRHPLARAVRLDKLSLAALAATLRLYRPPCDPFARVPMLRLLTQSVAQMQKRAETLLALIGAVPGLDCEIVDSQTYAGGGAMPMHALPGRAIALDLSSGPTQDLARRLRTGNTPVIGHITRDRLLLEMRTIEDGNLPVLAQAIHSAMA